MRNTGATAAALVLFAGIIGIISDYASGTDNSNRINSQTKRLESFTSRYTLPTNDPSLIAKLPFTFGYRFTDDYGTTQSREEKTDPNGAKTGSYSFIDSSGIYRRVDYIADHHGFRATVRTNEPGTLNADPAHVRVQMENDFNAHPPRGTPILNSPQLEYSSHIFSRFNINKSQGPQNHRFVEPVRNLRVVNQNALLNSGAIFDADRISQRKPPQPFNPSFQSNINPYKNNPLIIQSQIRPPLLQTHNGNAQNIYAEPVVLKSNMYFDVPNVNQEYIFGEKMTNVGYNNPSYSLVKPVTTPTRYPRRLRQPRPRPKNSPQYEIHIPRGYENYPELPLYRDK